VLALGSHHKGRLMFPYLRSLVLDQERMSPVEESGGG